MSNFIQQKWWCNYMPWSHLIDKCKRPLTAVITDGCSIPSQKFWHNVHFITISYNDNDHTVRFTMVNYNIAYKIAFSSQNMIHISPSRAWYRDVCWSHRYSWNIACWRCSNYIFILDLTHGFNGLGKDNCKMRQETFKFWDLVWLILEVWQ